MVFPFLTTKNKTNLKKKMWTRSNIRLLIDQRKYRNDEYHFENGISKREFWRSVAQRINRVAGTNFNYRQCSRKWTDLIKAFNVNEIFIITLYIYKYNKDINVYIILGYGIIY